MKRFIAILLFLLLAGVVSADMTVVQKVHSDAAMGQPAQDNTLTTYVKGKKALMEYDNRKMSILIDIDAGKMYTIDHGKKEAMSMPTSMAKQSSEYLKKMTGGETPKVAFNKTGKSETINGWKCEEYTIKGTGSIGIDAVYWITEDIDATEMEAFKEFGQDMAKAFGSEELMKLKGMPVRTISKMTMFGQTIGGTSEVLKVNHDSIAAGKFAVPTGYKMTEMPSMPQMPKE